MKINFNISRKIWQRWKWVWYPVTVFVVVVGSAVFVLFGGISLWYKLVDQGQVVDKQAAVISAYKKKVADLSLLNKDVLDASLQTLSGALPYSARVWVVVNLARVSGDEVGSKLVEWRAFGGEVVGDQAASGSAITKVSDVGQTMTGLFDVQNIEQLRALLTSFERRLPLVAVKRVVYVPGKTQIDLEAKWAAFTRVAPMADQPLPTATAALAASVQKSLEGYQRIPEVQALGGGVVGKNNPF